MNRNRTLATVTRLISALLFAGALVVVQALPAPAQAQDEQVIRSSVQRLATAWNAGNGEGWAAEFWPEGSLINILGVVFPNRSAVANVTNAILTGPFKGSTFTPEIRRLRFVGADGAVADTDVSVTNYPALPPGALETRPGLLLTRLTLFFEKRSGIWKIQAAQNTSVLPSALPPATRSPS